MDLPKERLFLNLDLQCKARHPVILKGRRYLWPAQENSVRPIKTTIETKDTTSEYRSEPHLTKFTFASNKKATSVGTVGPLHLPGMRSASHRTSPVQWLCSGNITQLRLAFTIKNSPSLNLT